MLQPEDDKYRDSLTEQRICVACGLCCDGTLFERATLQPGEKGTLPDKMDMNYFRIRDVEYFRLPCPYFREKFTIYDQKKAIVCSAFRCRVLDDLTERKVTEQDAMETVKRAVEMRNEIQKLHSAVSGREEPLFFREILHFLGRIFREMPGGTGPNANYEILLARCNIFQSLLTRYFQPSQEFEKLIMK